MISVIMPVYNGAATIGRAIDSVLQQEEELELIIVDDCSSDGLSEILAPYLASGKVTCIHNHTNQGAAVSRNIGVAAADGTYVAFLDADDAWMPGKLTAQRKLLEKTGGVLCCTARRLMAPGTGRDGHVIHAPEKITYHDLLGHNSIGCSSVLMLRSVALEFPMEHAEVHEDYLTWLKILQKYRVCYGIDEPYLLYQLSTTGKSGSKLHSAGMTFGVYRRLGLSLPHSLLCFARYMLHGVYKYYIQK